MSMMKNGQPQPRSADGRYKALLVKPPVPMPAPKGYPSVHHNEPDPALASINEAYDRLIRAKAESVDEKDNWECRDCGTTDPRRRYPDSSMLRCKNCQRYYNLSVNSKKERRDGHAPGLTFEREAFLDWMSKQPMRCALCGIEEENLGDLDLKSSIGRRVVALGIDRVDNSGGYDFDNMQLCCYACNKAKGNVFTGTESSAFLGGQIAKIWTERALHDGTIKPDQPYPFEFATVERESTTCSKCGYFGPEAATSCAACYKYKSLARNAEKVRVHANTPGLDMTAEEFGKWMEGRRRACGYCGMDEPGLRMLDVKTSVGHTLQNLGIDRIDNNKSYSVDNITFCCYACNKAKGNVFTGSEMRDFLGPGISYIWAGRIFNENNPAFRARPE